MATLSSAARNAAIGVPECISLFQQHLENIRDGTPDAALRNPVPRGRSIAPYGPTYMQLKQRCEAHGNAEVNRLLTELATLQLRGPGAGPRAVAAARINEMIDEMIRLRVENPGAPAANHSASGSDSDSDPEAAPVPARTRAPRAQPAAAPEVVHLPGSGVVSQLPPGARPAHLYSRNFITTRTNAAIDYLRNLATTADVNTLRATLTTHIPHALNQFTQDIGASRAQLVFAIARLYQIYFLNVRRNFVERPAVIRLIREYLQPYVDALPGGHHLRNVFMTQFTPRLEQNNGVIRTSEAVNNLITDIVNAGVTVIPPPRARAQARARAQLESHMAPRNTPGSPPARSPITESPILADGVAAADFLGECVVTFGDLPRPFDGLGNKLAKICNKISNRNQCSVQNVSRFYENIQNEFLLTNTGAALENKWIRINEVQRGQELKRLILYFLNKTDPDRSIMLRRPIFIPPYISIHSITFQARPGASGAIGPGPTRDFFQTAANQMFSPATGIFKETSNGSGRVMINTTFDVSTIDPSFANSNENRHLLFRMIGQFSAFLMVLGIKYDVHLCHYIQARMLYKANEISDDELMMYYFMDFPEDRTGRVAMLKRPDDIQHLGLDFNDEMELDPARANEALTAANYAEYTRLIARKKLEIAEGEVYVRAFVDGFYVSRTYLRRARVTVPILDTLLSGREVSVEDMNIVIERIRRNSELFRYRSEAVNQKLEWFIEILGDRGELFPTAVAAERPDTYAQNADEFKRQLLFWWSASRYVSDTMDYRVQPEGGLGAYFRAHTCTATIDFPPRIASREEMYANLLRQIADTDFNML